MENLYEKIKEAKEALGEKAALIIASELPIENWNEEKLSGKSPFNDKDNTPSFLWNAKENCFKDFSTGKNYGIIDFYMDKYSCNFVSAAKKLFDLVGVKYADNEFKILKTSKENFFDNYKYPKEETNPDRDKVESYLSKRGISIKTLDYMGVKQDLHGNVVFELRDVEDKLLAVKYRPSRAVSKSELKMWWQKNADMCPSLYNINRIDITKPLVIVEGFCDALSVVEAGYKNVVSIPGGAEDLSWIEFNYDFLQSVNEIILWFDNDKAGQSGLQKAISRIGEYKCRIVKPTKEQEDSVEAYYKTYNKDLSVRKTDANNILLACGKNDILNLIDSAEEVPLNNIVDLMTIEEFDIEKVGYTPTGFVDLDKEIYGYVDGTVNAWTAYSGCVDCDTEFFNGKEWKKISEWKNGDKVLQYNSDGTATLVNPLAYHRYKCDKLWEFKTKYGINQCLSDEHTVVYIDNTGNLCTIPFANMKKIHQKNKQGFGGNFIRTFFYSGSGVDLTTPQIELMCAVICDGSFTHNKTNLCRFHIKKERKQNKLREIFNKCKIPYREKQSTKQGYIDFWAYVPRREKTFSEYWYSCTQDQLKVIVDNVLFWDGCETNGRKSFSTTVKETADFIQFAFTACGYSASITTQDRRGQIKQVGNTMYTRKTLEYRINISERKYSRMMGDKKAEILEYIPKDGYKYCFTVPSHMWVMRRGDRIVVTGNCGKSTMLTQSVVLEGINRGESVFWFNAELTTSQMLNWVLSQAAGRDHTIEYTTPTGFKYYKPTLQSTKAIKDFYKDKILVYDNLLLTSPEDVLNKMKDVYNRRGTKIFVLDNWLCLNFSANKQEDINAVQLDFLNRLIQFTKNNDLEVHIVSHPRKPQAGVPLTEYDILGSSAFVNLMDRIYGFEIPTDKKIKELGFDRQVTVFKDRVLGKKGFRMGVKYDKATRRLYGQNDNMYKKYSWDDGSVRYSGTQFGDNGVLIGRRILDIDAPSCDEPY